MEVLVPVQSNIDFEPSPFLSAPSTPKRFGHYYFTTPSSPLQQSKILYDFDEFSIVSNSMKKKGTTTSNPKYEVDFAFDVTTASDYTSTSAEELFDGGKIRPLRPQTPPRIPRERGRTKSGRVGSGRGDRGARSVSPLRVTPWEEQEEEEQKQSSVTGGKKSIAPVTSVKGCRKWKLKDFFLFRSKSEGHGVKKDFLMKFTDLFIKHQGVDESFRALEGSSGRRGRVSAHELHHTVNRRRPRI